MPQTPAGISDSSTVGLRRSRVAIVAAAVLTALFFAPSVSNGFVWDDMPFVEPIASGRAQLGALLSSDLYRIDPTHQPSGYYRPVATLSLWVNAQLGDGAAPLHVGNVLIHALTTAALCFLLIRRIGSHASTAAALATIAWALHPARVEPVAWISSRYDLLTGLAAVSLLALPWRPGWRCALLHGSIFLAGMLSKEGFVVIGAVVAVDDWAARRPARAAARRWLAMGSAVLAWVGLRRALDIASIDPGHLTLAPASYLAMIYVELHRTVAPLPLSVSHAFSPTIGSVMAGVAALAGLGVVAWRVRALAPAVALFVFPVLPVALASAGLGLWGERYLYVPSLGLAWLVAGGLERLFVYARFANMAGTAIAGVVFFGAWCAAARIPEWRDEATLFRAADALDPGDPLAAAHLGWDAASAGRADEARAILLRGQSRAPSYARLAELLSCVELMRGDSAAAVAQGRRAVALDARIPRSYFCLGVASHDLGDHETEAAALERAVAIAPSYTLARGERALARCERERAPSCEQEIGALAVAATDRLELLIEAALRRGDPGAATERFRRFAEVSPGDPRLLHLRGRIAEASAPHPGGG